MGARKSFANRAAASLRGLTLIEILAAVAVVAVLAALLTPSLQRARQSALASGCLSNLHQIDVGNRLYLSDNDNRLIPICVTGGGGSQTWRILLAPYLNLKPTDRNWRVYQCPAAPVDTTDTVQGLHPHSYGINYEFGYIVLGLHDYFSQMGKRTWAVNHSSATIFMCDVGLVKNPALPPAQWTEKPGGNFGYARFPVDPSFSSDAWDIMPRHAGRANVLYYDGHCGSVDLKSDIFAHPPGDPQCLYDNH